MRSSLTRFLVTAAAVSVVLLPAGAARADSSPPFTGNAPRPASCSSGDTPETGVQGEVTLADRASGRSKLGYSCNLSLVGQDQGDGASWVDPIYGHCAYKTRSAVGNITSLDPGVKVVDVSDPAHPVTTATLTSPGMLTDNWESLKVNQAKGLLAGLSVPVAAGGVFFSIYDIKTDCAHPRLLNSVLASTITLPVAVLGHEGGFSPDGNTYWASGVAAGSLTAIDVSNPAFPHVIYQGFTTLLGHGFDISPDGNRMYFSTTVPAGFITLDISQVQSRKLLPTVTNLGQVTFPNSTAPQHTIYVTEQGKPWIIGVDEIGTTGIHFADLSNAASPVVHPGVTLQIEQPANSAAATAESVKDVAGLFGYSPHYCSVDRIVDPTALACGYFQAGVRVFDIRDLSHPREIAYFNPPRTNAAFLGLNGSAHANAQGDSAVDWCTSPPSFHGSQLWVTCQDAGFMALNFESGVYPLPAASTTNLPSNQPTNQPTVAQPQRSLTAVGAPGWVAGLAVALAGSGVLLTLGRRRTHHGLPAGAVTATIVVLAAAFATPLLQSSSAAAGSRPSADVVFAQDMIAHHEQAVVMARAAETDPRTTPIDRTLAQGIDTQQSHEIGILRQWLRNWHAPQTGSDTIAPMTMGSPQALKKLDAAAYNRHFLKAMLAHHAAAMPIIQSALNGGTSPVRVLAQSMRIDQTLEMRWIDNSLSASPAKA